MKTKMTVESAIWKTNTENPLSKRMIMLMASNSMRRAKRKKRRKTKTVRDPTKFHYFINFIFGFCTDSCIEEEDLVDYNGPASDPKKAPEDDVRIIHPNTFVPDLY
jgi:hypothetical protein